MEDHAHALPKNCPVNSALSKIVVSEREKAAMDEGERERERGSHANRRDKKPMHVLLPAVR